jgi:hypothetical protein
VYNNGRFCHLTFSLFDYLVNRGWKLKVFSIYWIGKNFLRRALQSLAASHFFKVTHQVDRLQVFLHLFSYFIKGSFYKRYYKLLLLAKKKKC